jgi:RNA polymerase sigma-70 factor (ECF subfamily)
MLQAVMSGFLSSESKRLLALAPPGAGGEEAAALSPIVRAVVASVLGERRDHPDVDDCTHEAIRRAIEGRSRLRDGEPLRPWMIGIARHVALDARRSRKRARMQDTTSASGEHSLVELVDPGPAPDEHAAGAERARRVDAILSTLPAQQKEALLLFHVEGVAYQEIAARMNVPMGTVATWLSRGRKTLADALGDKGES